MKTLQSNETSQAHCSNQTKMQVQKISVYKINLNIITSQIEDDEMSVFNMIRKKSKIKRFPGKFLNSQKNS